jgi:hypothetical protein
MTHWRQKPKTGKRSFAERLSERRGSTEFRRALPLVSLP